MSSRVSPVPVGFHTVTPAIIVKDPDAAIDLYKRAFGAEEVMVVRSPDGSVMHAEIRIGDSIIMLGAEWPDIGMVAPQPQQRSSSLHLYIADTDQAFQKAVQAGCQPVMPPADMFWGGALREGCGSVRAPLGACNPHRGGLA